MDQEYKARENRVRRFAARQGMRLLKSRVRDPRARGHGLYALVPARSSRLPTPSHYSMTLDEAEAALLNPEGLPR